MTQNVEHRESPEREPLRIFVSYRRTDAPAHAGRLYDRLIAAFDERNVFMDVDTIDPGLDFRTEMQSAVGKCDALVAVIGKKWTGSRFLRSPRIESETDYVRVEVEAALARRIRVIPVLVEEAHLPSADDLPGSMRDLLFRNALPIRDVSFHSDASRLVEALEKLAREKASGVVEVPPEPSPPAPRRPPRIYERRRLPRTTTRSVVVATAAVALAAAGAIIGWYASRGSSSPTAPTSVPAAAALRWTRVRGGAAVFGGDKEQVALAVTPIRGGQAAEAVGFEGSGPARRALAWRFDGRRWLPDDGPSPPDQIAKREAVAAAGSVVVAGGRATMSLTNTTPMDPAVWIRRGKQTGWTLICLRDLTTETCTDGKNAKGVSAVHALLALKGDGFVAVGAQAENDVPHAAVWSLNNDGSSPSEPYEDQDARRSEMDAVVDAGGHLVAVGVHNGHALAWIGSPNGLHWEPQAPDAALFDVSVLNAVARRGRTLVAGGIAAAAGSRCAPTRAAVLTSADGGVSWTRRRSPAFDATASQILGVVAYARWFVALGFVRGRPPDCNQIAAAWTSRDGAHWTRAKGLGFRTDSVLNGGAVVRGTLFATGNAASGTGRDAAIWNVTGTR